MHIIDASLGLTVLITTILGVVALASGKLNDWLEGKFVRWLERRGRF